VTRKEREMCVISFVGIINDRLNVYLCLGHGFMLYKAEQCAEVYKDTV
jgi:hypothetical protein